jgi:hypothetical protein
LPTVASASVDPPDEAIVLRGGVITVALVRATAERHFREKGSYEVSVFASAQLDVPTIILAAREHDQRAVPHKRVQVTTARAIRAIGCELVRDEPPPCHCSLKFAEAPSDDLLDALAGAFGEPMDNPHPP